MQTALIVAIRHRLKLQVYKIARYIVKRGLGILKPSFPKDGQRSTKSIRRSSGEPMSDDSCGNMQVERPNINPKSPKDVPKMTRKEIPNESRVVKNEAIAVETHLLNSSQGEGRHGSEMSAVACSQDRLSVDFKSTLPDRDLRKPSSSKFTPSQSRPTWVRSMHIGSRKCMVTVRLPRLDHRKSIIVVRPPQALEDNYATATSTKAGVGLV